MCIPNFFRAKSKWIYYSSSIQFVDSIFIFWKPNLDSISSWRANWTQIERPIPPNSGFVLHLILDLFRRDFLILKQFLHILEQIFMDAPASDLFCYSNLDLREANWTETEHRSWPNFTGGHHQEPENQTKQKKAAISGTYSYFIRPSCSFQPLLFKESS